MTRRFTIALLASLMLLASACGDDSEGETADQAPPATNADAGGDADPGGEAPDDADEGGSTASGSSGRLEIGEDSYNFWLGDMTTAMCSVGDDVLIEDMRASDGTRVSAVVSSGISEITLRDPDGNRIWVTGNSGEAEGVTVSIQTVDNVLMVNGTWVDPNDPATTEQGNLVVTC